MTHNSESIMKHIDQYKEMYFKQFNEYPTSWFSYLKWLGSWTFSGNFTAEEIEIAKKVIA
jgi:hypothetical protein